MYSEEQWARYNHDSLLRKMQTEGRREELCEPQYLLIFTRQNCLIKILKIAKMVKITTDLNIF